MTAELPSDGPEREIFLMALRNYSDCCEPPYLTPGCPFAIDMADGTRGCGEECIELLAVYEAPLAIDEEHQEDGIRIQRRRRSRRRTGPEPRAKAFDAAEIWFADETRQPELWATVSLIREFGRLLKVVPPLDHEAASERRERTHRVAELLQERGLDPADLVAGGLAIGLSATMVVHGLSLSEEPNDSERYREYVEIREKWTWLEGTRPNFPIKDMPREPGHIAELILRVLLWVRNASLDDLINWEPSGPPPPSSSAAFSDATQKNRWIVDRFSETYLEDWQTHPCMLSGSGCMDG